LNLGSVQALFKVQGWRAQIEFAGEKKPLVDIDRRKAN
jgi:hypothetical protein